MKRYYTDKEYRQLIKNMVILCDTKDKQNKHILDEFDKQKIEYKTRALKTGDYSFMIKACPELGFQYDTYFTDELCIERKNSLSELAGNLAQKTDDNRIFKEQSRLSRRRYGNAVAGGGTPTGRAPRGVEPLTPRGNMRYT